MTQYIGIHSEGGLIPYDVLDKIAKEEGGLGQQAKDFELPAGRRLTDEIARAWSDAQDYWHIFQRRSSSLPENETGATLTRKWVTDLLNELLGFELAYQQTGAVIGGKNYPISHRAGESEESPPVQIEGFRADLDKRSQARRLSPQALVQEYLNNSGSHLWGTVSNGFLLRLLRDTSRTARPSYLEFDLQSILDGNRFNEFAVFYRVCHRTRLPRTAEDSTSCWLEKYFQLSIEQGGRVRDKLRDGVEDALKTLGTGFLRHPKNEALRERVKTGTLTAAEFHRQLLRLVYRLLFLMVAEERRMIVPEGPEADRCQSLFDRYYSVGRLRSLTEKAIEPSTFGDLWIGLQQTFALFEDNDSNPLGIPPLNGDLFSAVAVKDLQGTHLYNNALLAAMGRLSLFEDHRVRQRVNYGALDVEELGSVYESLLDFQPVFTEQPEGMTFELRTGSERKSTGSYYTRPELVRELIESALVPVMQDRLAGAKDSDPAKEKEKREQAILSMSVCDPACGSGHFLLAAARRLGRELAKVRTGEDEPTPKEFHLAVRDVIAHCIYGVDVNPLAVDLCKLALWLEGHWTGKPLSFLDHRIKCGNSLIGVLAMDVLKGGIPDEAFSPVTGDDKRVASAFKRKNRDERRGQSSLPFDAAEHVHQYANESQQFVSMAEDTTADVRRKKEAYERARQKMDWWHDWIAANLWTAAFFVPLTKYDDPVVPTHGKFMAYLRGQHVETQMEEAATGLATELRFFHWTLEFPEVFQRGGFDVVLGNPPWDRPEFHESQYWVDDRYIAEAATEEERKGRIQEYRESADPSKRARAHRYELAVHAQAACNSFWRDSTRFEFTAIGKFNVFALFCELGFKLLGRGSRAGILVPTGIGTDDVCKNFFADVTAKEAVVSFFNIENRLGWFLDVDSRVQFALLTLSTSPARQQVSCFYLLRPEERHDPLRQLFLTVADFRLLNPNTKTSPLFRTTVDQALTTKIYRHNPILLNKSNPANSNHLRITRVFNMGNSKIKSKASMAHRLEREGYRKDDQGCYSHASSVYLPLLESKLIHQFNNRFATYKEVNDPKQKPYDVPSDRLVDTNYLPLPRFWYPAVAVRDFFGDEWTRPWLLVFRDIARSTDERTMIASVVPYTATDLTLRVVVSPSPTSALALLLGNLNSLVLDYIVRQFLPSTHISDYISEQLAIVPSSRYTILDREFVIPRIVELVYTNLALRGFAKELGHNGNPFVWNEARRTQLRAEIDACYAHLYGLTRDELRYILDPRDVFGEDFPSETFRVLKEGEEMEYGEYRTRRLVLEAFDQLAESPRFRDEMSVRECALNSRTSYAQSTAD